MSSSTTCSVVDDYAVMFNGALYIRKVNKDAAPDEKKQRSAIHEAVPIRTESCEESEEG